jgi:hypothetical protein
MSLPLVSIFSTLSTIMKPMPTSIEKEKIMRIKKSLLIAGAVTGVSLVGVSGIGIASAASNSSSTGTDSSLVDKIASTFNLDKSKVQAVFDSNRQEKEAEHQAQLEKALSQLVTDGKITATQKTAILAKQKELQTTHKSEHQSLKNKTAAERKAYMEQERSALEQWAKDNNLPTEYLRYVMGGSHRGPGGPDGVPEEVPTATTN